MSDDEYEHLDAAYVLGALPPAERQDFEHHLERCDVCARSVRELAGLPGLLGRLDADEVAALGTTAQMPGSLLPSLLREAGRRRQRRRLLSLAAAVSTAAAVVLVTLVLSGPWRDSGGTGTEPRAAAPVVVAAQPRAMSQVGQDLFSADVSLQDMAWGTRMRVSCRYHGTPPRSLGPLDYALVVRTRAGTVQQVATWRGVPGKVVTFDAATAAHQQDIAKVEVRTLSGLPLLRLTL